MQSKAVITSKVSTADGVVIYFTCPDCSMSTTSLEGSGPHGICQKCGASVRLVSRAKRFAKLPLRSIMIQSLVWLMAIAAPFGTVLLAFMVIVYVNRPGIDAILAVYAFLICLEAMVLVYLTNLRAVTFSGRALLFAVFAVTSTTAPVLMFVYAFVRVGGH